MLECPVDGRRDIEGEQCPQCDADLGPLARFDAAVRALDEQTRPMAAERPAVVEPAPQSTRWAVLAAAFVLGAIVTGVTMSAVRGPRGDAAQTASTATAPPVAIGDPVATPPAKPPDSSSPPVTTYRVQAGDTFWSIAQRHYGTATVWRRLHTANRDRFPAADRLAVGDQIMLPALTLEPR